MSDPFASPAAAGAGVDLKELNGSLLLVTVHAVETGINTVHGASDAIRADVAVLDGTQAGNVHEDTLLFPKVLQGQLKSRIGQKVLGRLGQGTAKPGQSAPWILAEATDADRATATAYLAKGFAAPASSAAPF